MLNRQGKTRLSKWYVPYPQKERERIIKDLAVQVTHRNSSMCNFLEWREFTVVYKRYASLYFILCVDKNDNELITLELIHRYVFILDKYFGNVTELDLIYDFSRAYLVLDELLIAGEQQESSAAEVLRSVDQQDELHKAELVELAMNSSSNSAPRYFEKNTTSS